jgi:hypothetical protein
MCLECSFTASQHSSRYFRSPIPQCRRGITGSVSEQRSSPGRRGRSSQFNEPRDPRGTIATYLADHGNISIANIVSSQSDWGTGVPQDPFIGRPPFPNSEGVPVNSYSVGGNMTQLQVTSYGESGVCPIFLSVLCLTPRNPSRSQYSIPLHRNGSHS